MDIQYFFRKKIINFTTLFLFFILSIVVFMPLTQAQTPLPAAPPLREGRFGVVQTYDAPDAATAVGAGWTHSCATNSAVSNASRSMRYPLSEIAMFLVRT